MGRCFGRFVLVLFLLEHALAHVSGQVASANRTLPTAASKTDENVTIPLGFSQKSFPDAMIGVPYESSVQAIGGSGLYDLSATGDMPPGLSMETGASTLAFGGVPTTTGTYAFQVIIRDADGTSFTHDFSIQVYPRVLGAKALQTSPAPSDSEGITLTDVDAVFLPAKVLDNESIKLTDAVAGLDAAEIPDNESIALTDTITVAILTLSKISWSAPAPITYGTALSATQLDATGNVAGTFTYTPPAGTVLSAGQQTITATFTPTDHADYAPATATATLTVNQATQSITFAAPTSPVTYPVSPISLSATGGASGNPVTFSILSGPGSLSGTNNALLTVNGGGTIVVAANQAGNTDYSVAPQVTQSILVDQLATLTSPAPSTALTGSSATFTWTAGAGVTQYVLGIGSKGVGSYDLFNSTPITATQVSVTGLPTNGETLYARLYSWINGAWQYVDYTYTASATPAVLTSPAPGSVLTSSSVTFQWTAGSGVTQYVLGIGSMGVGSYDLFNSTPITATQASVTGLPTNGETLYARLYSWINGAWQYNDYIYTAAATPAVLTSPTPGSALTSSSVTFQWTAGAGVTQYVLGIGSTGVGSYDLFNSTPITATQASVTGLPTNGETLYARIYSWINGAWQYHDYTYTATATPAVLTTPTPGSTLSSSSVTFQWTAGAGVTQYVLGIGSTGVGSYNLYNSTPITATQASVSGLPTNGETLYARLYSWINGAWQYKDYTYTAQ